MGTEAVVLKSNPYGLILNLDPALPFSELSEAVGEKFRQSRGFFKDAQLAVTFRGRALSGEEELRLIDVIGKNSDIRIACIRDEDPKEALNCREAVERAEESAEKAGLPDQKKEAACFYRGTLKSGQTISSDLSILILGDVNPGAKAVSKRNVVVLGCCMGTIHAGTEKDTDCYAAALTMLPAEIRVSACTARSAIRKKTDTGDYPVDPKIAFVHEGHLQLKPITKETLMMLAAD